MPSIVLRPEIRRDGKRLASVESLTAAGPVAPVTLKPLADLEKVLESQGRPRLSVSGRVLIDTGAKRTAVDISAAQELALPIKDRAVTSSATHRNVVVPVFSGRLEIPGFLNFDVPQGLMGVNLHGNRMNIIALIGRDLLGAAILIYNGMDGHFSISV